MKRRFTALLLAAALVLSLAACGGPGGASSSAGSAGSSSGSAPPAADPVPEVPPFQLPYYPEFSLHPALADSRPNLTLAPLLYEPLFQLDRNFQAVPVLCQRYTVNVDKTTWVFTLREGVTFSDGTLLTGSVAADALNAARKSGSRFAARLANIASVTAEGQGALIIELRKPNGELPALLDVPIALGTGDRPAGTGPYVLSEDGDSPRLTARTDWWQGAEKAIPARELPLAPMESSDQLIAAFDSGTVGLVDVDPTGTSVLGYSGSSEAWDYPTADFLYLGFNVRSGLCRSAAVRRALALTVDRAAVAQTDYANHAVPAALPVHPDSPLYNQELAGALACDPEAAAAGLEEAGAAGKTLKLVVNSENSFKAAAAQRVAAGLESAGLTVELERLPFEEFTAALAAGEFDLYLGEVVLTAEFDLSALLSSAGSLNYGGWSDGQTDTLLANMEGSAGEWKQAAADELFAYLNEQVPIVPIAFKNGSVLTQWGRLTGLVPVRENVFFGLENWTIQ